MNPFECVLRKTSPLVLGFHRLKTGSLNGDCGTVQSVAQGVELLARAFGSEYFVFAPNELTAARYDLQRLVTAGALSETDAKPLFEVFPAFE